MTPVAMAPPLLVCSDRGAHPTITLGYAPAYSSIHIDRATRDATSTPTPRHWQAVRHGLALVTAPDGHRTLNVRCKRCGRHAQWREEHASALLERMITAGVAAFDISRL